MLGGGPAVFPMQWRTARIHISPLVRRSRCDMIQSSERRYWCRQSAVAYWLISLHIGRPLPQNKHGHLLGHVKDHGGYGLLLLARCCMPAAWSVIIRAQTCCRCAAPAQAAVLHLRRHA